MNLVVPVLISGKQGSGKTELSSRIDSLLINRGGFSTVHYKFAKPLYDMHDAVRKVLENYKIPFDATKKDGRLLQLLGTEYGREVFGQDVWVTCALAFLKNTVNDNSVRGEKLFLIIDDLRFKNEFEAFSRNPLSFTIRLECEREIRKSRCESWREIENHLSEIDLDDWTAKFDVLFNTDSMDAEDVAEECFFVLEKHFQSFMPTR